MKFFCTSLFVIVFFFVGILHGSTTIRLGFGPLWTSGIFVLLPEEIVESTIPLVSQSSIFAPYNLGAVFYSDMQYTFNKYLAVQGAIGAAVLHNGEALIRSFTQNEAVPSSARSIPFEVTDNFHEGGVNVSVKFISPIVCEQFKLEALLGFIYKRGFDQKNFLQNSTIFFNHYHLKGPYIGASLGTEVDDIEFRFFYNFLLGRYFNRATQNTSSIIQLQRIKTHTSDIGISVTYKFKENMSISQTLSFADTRNSQVGVSTIFNQQPKPITLHNIISFKGRAVVSLTKFTFMF